MTSQEAAELGYEIVVASHCEVGLAQYGQGIRTWFCQEFDGNLPPLDHPKIQRAIHVHRHNGGVSDLTIGKYELRQTCGSHPEQYEVFLDDKQVGYLRLRHGGFSARTPDVDGVVVFSSNPRGDGDFEDDEREIHLNAAIASIAVHLARKPDDEL